jgi:hypothetical protein
MAGVYGPIGLAAFAGKTGFKSVAAVRLEARAMSRNARIVMETTPYPSR